MSRVSATSVIVVALAMVGACSVEKMPPIRMVHRAVPMMPKRATVLPTECTPSETAAIGEDPRAWCRGIEAIVASELAFHGVEIVDLSKLPARERSRNIIEVTTTLDGADSERRQVTVTGPTYSDVDMWTQRTALDTLGVDALVRVRAAHLATWPVRTLAMIRLTRPADASLIAASVCELEVSRIDSDAETIERAVRCALGGLTP